MKVLLFISGILLLVASIDSRRHKEEDSCSSESSESSEEHKHHHHHHRRSTPVPVTQRVPKCEDGWIVSNRPQGDWCLKVLLVNLEYPGASVSCLPLNATLSGIQNAWERMTIANEALKIVTPMGLDRAGIWLGMQRITGTKVFQWTDGHTVGTEGYAWGPTQPDDSPVRGHQNCAQIVALSPSYPSGRPDFYWNYQNGWMDDIYCTGEWLPPTRLVACGKVPS